MIASLAPNGGVLSAAVGPLLAATVLGGPAGAAWALVMKPPSTQLPFVLQRTFEEVFEPDSVAEDPLVRFSAYASHHRLFGWVRLRADRLADLLNAHEELLRTDVEIENLMTAGGNARRGSWWRRGSSWPCTLRVHAATARSAIGPGHMPSPSGPARTWSPGTSMPSRVPTRSRACDVAPRWSH